MANLSRTFFGSLFLVQISFFQILYFFKIYLFIFGCIGSSLLCTGFLQLWRVEATLHCGAQASHCGGFSHGRARAPGARASVVVACRLSTCGSRAPERRLSSCGARAQLLRGPWDPPGPGLEPVSPALAGGLSTAAPPGKPLYFFFKPLFFSGNQLFGNHVIGSSRCLWD